MSNRTKQAAAIESGGKLNLHACLKCVQELANDPGIVCVFGRNGTRCSRCVAKATDCRVIPMELLDLADSTVAAAKRGYVEVTRD
ncbi:MAG: hypothetical protein M1830_007408 [Pleopsidium flavum]|nr:MAG: hypothetical protein M1830_007408 [Pleopsidium flavum]